MNESGPMHILHRPQKAVLEAKHSFKVKGSLQTAFRLARTEGGEAATFHHFTHISLQFMAK